MAKYRKKPVVIEAVRYEGSGNMENHEVPDWIWDALESGVMFATSDGRDPMTIKTLEGNHIVSPGDFIIQGVKRELYSCKPDIFALTYEKVDQE
ncbi:MAG: hypothetical protein ABIC57_04050 [bacterium]